MRETIPIGEKDIDFDFLVKRAGYYELKTVPGSELELLPSISLEWEGYLKLKNIGYNKIGDECVIYAKELYESESVELPVYEEIGGMYKYTGKNRLKKVPTKESLEAAKEIFEEFMEYITEIQLIEDLRQMMGEKIMIFIQKPTQMPLKKYDLMGKYRIFVYEVGKIGFILVNCKRVAKMKKNGNKITAYLNVPSKYLRDVVGINGKNIEPLKRFVGLDKINVLPID